MLVVVVVASLVQVQVLVEVVNRLGFSFKRKTMPSDPIIQFRGC